MTNFDRFLRLGTIVPIAAILLLAAAFCAPSARATSYSYSPDTVTFTPTGLDSVIGYVRIAYNGDTTGPGTYIHAWISSGSSYFSVPTDTVKIKSYYYLRIKYMVQTTKVYGVLSLSDDTVTHTVVLIGNTYQTSDGELTSYGPYFPTNVPEGKDTCTTMRLINTGSDVDTIVSAGWTHNPNGIFTWDSVSIPSIMPSKDTAFWTFCFDAPDNTSLYIDTFIVSYHDAYSQTRYISRIIEGEAVAPTDGELMSEGPYFPSVIPEGADTCITSHSSTNGYPLRLINSGSDVDTIVSIAWSHDPAGIFTWDSVSIPYAMPSKDTVYWTYCFHAPDNTNTYADTITIHYHDASSQSRYITRVISAKATDTTPPDGVLTCVGPYFSEVVDEGHDTCTTMRIINTGDDLDTIVSAAWSHDPQGIFSWTSVSLPTTLGSHDTTNWTFCFDAPEDTNLHIDTFTVHYHDEYSQERYVTRIIEGKATDPSIVSCYNLYANAAPVTNYHDTSYIHLFIGNHLKNSTSLTSIHISGTDDASFRVDSSNFPVTIAANSYDSLWIMFIPGRSSGNSEYAATLTANFSTSDTSHCKEASVWLLGYMPQICSDTQTVYFDTTGTDDVNLSGDTGHYYAHRIDFVNNSSETVIVSAVSWTLSSSHFLISQVVSALPDTLAPGAGMAVIVHFYGDSSGSIYYDTLALTIGNGIILHKGKFTPTANGSNMFFVNFAGYSNAAPTSSVATPVIPNAPELQLYPNPSSGLVNIELGEGAANTLYQVMDILGHVIATHSGAGVWQLDASSTSGISDGTYLIRASTTDASGNLLITTKRFVLKR